ncbi:MAG: putative LPS assembly protein LptD, partial [Candidatus Zixiibacteriota bacterium]
KISHNPAINLPSLRFGNYLNVIPRFSYAETWFKIHQTDQSDAAGINPSTTYRTYSYRWSVSANSKIYGTIYPNFYGLLGLRHVITPTVGYSSSPDINLHSEVRSFAGGGAGSSKSSLLTFSLNQLFQAKVRKGAIERNLQLLSLTSNFSYNLENEERPFSNLQTSFQSSALPIITSVSGRMQHSFYQPNTDDLNFWSPFLLSFNINANINLAGQNFFFDDAKEILRRVDSLSQIDRTAPTSGVRKGWSLSATYSYSETGRGSNWSKSSFINFLLRFNLTPTTTISYSQRYSIDRKLTIRNSVNIVKKIHCWTGSIFWVPVGSNRGFGFKLFVTALPEIKIDNNHDSFTQSFQR